MALLAFSSKNTISGLIDLTDRWDKIMNEIMKFHEIIKSRNWMMKFFPENLWVKDFLLYLDQQR